VFLYVLVSSRSVTHLYSATSPTTDVVIWSTIVPVVIVAVVALVVGLYAYYKKRKQTTASHALNTHETVTGDDDGDHILNVGLQNAPETERSTLCIEA